MKYLPDGEISHEGVELSKRSLILTAPSEGTLYIQFSIHLLLFQIFIFFWQVVFVIFKICLVAHHRDDRAAKQFFEACDAGLKIKATSASSKKTKNVKNQNKKQLKRYKANKSIVAKVRFHIT